jgi:hypothetical protein
LKLRPDLEIIGRRSSAKSCGFFGHPGYLKQLLDQAEGRSLPHIHKLIDRLDGKASQAIEYDNAPIRELTDSQLRIASQAASASSKILKGEPVILIAPRPS